MKMVYGIRFKAWFFLISLYLIPGTRDTSFAQQINIDSLLTLLKKDKEDTTKVNHLNDLGWEYKYKNPDTAIILGNQALEILNSKYQITSSKFQEGKKTLGLGSWDLKLGAFLANSLGNLGVYNWLKGDYPRALDYYFKALKLDE